MTYFLAWPSKDCPKHAKDISVFYIFLITSLHLGIAFLPNPCLHAFYFCKFESRASQFECQVWLQIYWDNGPCALRVIAHGPELQEPLAGHFQHSLFILMCHTNIALFLCFSLSCYLLILRLPWKRSERVFLLPFSPHIGATVLAADVFFHLPSPLLWLQVS